MKKAKKAPDVLIYSKWCVKCDYPEELQAIQTWAMHENLNVEVVRTAYRPKDHKKAVELWASMQGIPEDEAQDYPAFVVYNDIVELEEFVCMIKDTKNKLVKEGETKNDVHRRPQAKRTTRAHRVDESKDKD